MTKITLVLHTDAIRRKAADWCMRGRQDSRVTFEGPRRRLDQNARMWAMLGQISEQKEHAGRKYTPFEWKSLFLHALGREVDFLPSLDGQGIVTIGYQSSELSVEDMAALISLIEAWCAQNGVVLYDPHDPEAVPKKKRVKKNADK